MSISSLLPFLQKPFDQSGFFVLLTLVIIPFLRRKTANASWNVAGLMYLAFIVTNSIVQYFVENTWSYFFTSLGISVLYVLVIGTIVEWLIGRLKISGSGESATIFLFIIYHPVVLLGVILIRWIYLSF